MKTQHFIILNAAILAAIFIAGCSKPHATAPPKTMVQVPLTPQASTEATQTARSFFEAMGSEDWNAVAKLWPPNAPKRFDDIFTQKNKEVVSGLEIISLGTPYKEEAHSWVCVPYEVRFKNGRTQTNSLQIEQQPDGHWDLQGGGF